MPCKDLRRISNHDVIRDSRLVLHRVLGPWHDEGLAAVSTGPGFVLT
jgi:hypothetical protein